MRKKHIWKHCKGDHLFIRGQEIQWKKKQNDKKKSLGQANWPKVFWPAKRSKDQHQRSLTSTKKSVRSAQYEEDVCNIGILLKIFALSPLFRTITSSWIGRRAAACLHSAATIVPETEHVQFRLKVIIFRNFFMIGKLQTNFPSGVILDSKSNSQLQHRFKSITWPTALWMSTSRMQGLIMWEFHFKDNLLLYYFQTSSWVHGLSDDRWHSAQVRRLGNRILLYHESWGIAVRLVLFS